MPNSALIISYANYSLVTEQTLDQRDVSRSNLLHSTQMAFTLGSLLGQDMTSERLSVLVSAFAGSFEPFGSTTTCFKLWHD
jgi:hypothetical protein